MIGVLRISRAVAIALTFLAPGQPGAADTGLDRLTLRSETLGWEAVGRVDIGKDGGFCTGVLVATDLVLTAAHCLYDRGRRIDPQVMIFRAGLRDGKAVAEVPVRRAVIAAGYDPRDRDGYNQLLNDVALLQLHQTIPAGLAAPFSAGRRIGQGDAVSVVSYARGREAALSWQRRCRVTQKGPGALALSCDVDFGSSGAPVFDTSGGRARIVSIVSRGRRSDGGHVVYGMDIAGPLARLKADMRDGLRVFPKEVVQSKRIAPGTRNTSGGARFVRP